jgi:hypothetical protein
VQVDAIAAEDGEVKWIAATQEEEEEEEAGDEPLAPVEADVITAEEDANERRPAWKLMPSWRMRAVRNP